MTEAPETSPAGRGGRRGRPATVILVLAIAGGALLVGVTGARRVLREAPCGPGFVREGTRCLPPSGSACPPPLVAGPEGCDAPARDVVVVPATTVVIGPSDWEAEGRVAPRTVRTAAFLLDRFEVTVGRARAPGSPLFSAGVPPPRDAARALGGVTRAEARAFCAWRGGRLPTEDEWIVAAAGDRPRRYPWGDTGAVCRRAAWGLVHGPCAEGREAAGPDTVGAHPEGATPLGVHDLAGNVAEWVESVESVESAEAARDVGVVRGGSFATDMAAALRTWVRAELPAEARDPKVGFRCAYSSPPDGGVPWTTP